MSDVPYGVLLSGGLDSSVISAVAEKYSSTRVENGGETKAYWPRLHSFAVGLKGAPDLAKARLVAEHIGTVHHEINYTIQEGLDAIRDVIYLSRPMMLPLCVHLPRCICWRESSEAWVSRWCFRARVLTRYSEVISTSIKHRMPRHSMRKPYESWVNSISTIV